MRVLWITFWGTWSKPLLIRIKRFCHIEAIIPSESIANYSIEDYEGIPIHNLGFPKSHGIYSNMDYCIYSKYKKIIDTVHPDIIHVHGTEKNLAQIQNYCKDIPIVISIQGLLSGCLRYNLAYLSEKELLPYTSIKNRLKRGGLLSSERMCYRGYHNYEKDILLNGKFFIGRTLWDKAHITQVNPKASYFYGEEILRPVFYEKSGKWSLDSCRRHTVIMSSGFNPLKGMHFAILAISLLKNKYPDVLLKIPGIPKQFLERRGLSRVLIGEEYIEFCKSIIKEKQLENNIVFLPYLSDREMAHEMLSSHVFLSCSTIENSSNATGEASLLGVPMVVSAVGGQLSLYKDGENALLAPSGDYTVMSYLIDRLFSDDEYASNLSLNGTQISLSRHDPCTVTRQYIDIYNTIIHSFNEE